ncbi:MAG: hypothetical protein J6K29_08575 [Clostridia bacterium]|nr:hypothetical protein [Clostridia bacterium]
MKKQIRLIVAMIMLVTLATAFALCAKAIEPSNEGGHWVINAEKIDEILAGEAGEKTTGWEVPFMNVAPTLDGKISKGEYHPFEMYEDYLSYMAVIGTPDQGNTKEEFMEFYEMTNKDFFDAYWGWDGRYLYLAFEVRCVNGFNCKPEEMGGNVYLYAYNMMQLGIAPTDATGKDPDYVELGFGVHSDTGEPLTQAWMGPYKPVAGEDFMGTYDKENQVVVYEARVHLQTALQLKDKMVENGDEINLAWLLSVNGETSSVNDYWQVGFCHGIGGQYSHKMNQYFARVTFTGKDVDLPPEEIPGVSEEDLEYELVEFVDMSDEKAVKSFSGEDAAIDYITENGESFARITALGDLPYVWSKSYPRSLQSAECAYIAVKYRLPKGTETDMGILYRNAYYPEYDLENVYAESVGGDGEWKVVIFYMFGEEKWQNWIVNIGLAPFIGDEAAAGKTVDIAFMKFYLQDPYELYKELEYDPDKVEETTAEEAGTEEPTDAATQAPDTQVSDGNASTDPIGETEAPKEKGCGAAVSLGILTVLALGAVLTLKKKEN